MTNWLRPTILIAVLGLSGLAAGDEVPLSLAEYKAKLDQYSVQLQQIDEHPEHAVDFYKDIPESIAVQTQAGTITAHTLFLRDGLQSYLKAVPLSKRTILSDLSGRVKAMRAEADRFELARDGDAATRERLNRILSAREFGRLAGPTELELLEQRIRDWINRKMRDLFPKAPDLDQLGQIFVWIVIAIASSILAVWLYRRSRERLSSPAREIIAFVPSARSWRIWLAEAREKATLGQWREAIHLGFWAAVSRLESDGMWPPDKARTPREYLNAIPSVYEKKSSFATITRTFEVAWYGARPVVAADFDRFVAELEKLGCAG